MTTLLLGASIWGVAWYPFRLLQQAGISGELSTALTYLVALLTGLILFRKHIRLSKIRGPAFHLLLGIALCAGCASVAYTLGIIHGEVMRVLFLFYLAPLWTILFARMLLAERLSKHGYAIILSSLTGALLLLWQPGQKLPVPTSYGDWMGLIGGLMFALTNVLVRKDQQHDIRLKSLAAWSGTALIGFSVALMLDNIPNFLLLQPDTWLLLLNVGFLVFFLGLLWQYGLTHTPANQAIVILLFELVVASIAAHYLADEHLAAKDWVGGLLIVSASLFSARVNREPLQKKNPPTEQAHPVSGKGET
ncbi:DMT family transporter [Nitrosomonas sp. ANs5]|uniref:DMT family transporter n=1 Tax=Nitrosomonas sp. ANs5 TaxID=3423941 RepID=UPI003D33FE9C